MDINTYVRTIRNEYPNQTRGVFPPENPCKIVGLGPRAHLASPLA